MSFDMLVGARFVGGIGVGTKEEYYNCNHDGPLARDLVGNPSLVHCSNKGAQLRHARWCPFRRRYWCRHAGYGGTAVYL
jgi:hypothetical protein